VFKGGFAEEFFPGEFGAGAFLRSFAHRLKLSPATLAVEI
jgi:hypothetical protein